MTDTAFFPLIRALFLPRNFLWTLHIVELALFVLLSLDLWIRFFRRPRHAEWELVIDPGGSAEGQRRLPVRGLLVFGSNPGRGGVVLTESQVSRRHLEVRPGADGLIRARDLGSTNGSFRRGEDLRQEPAGVLLEPGDQVELGRSGPTLRFQHSRGRGRGGAIHRARAPLVRILAWLAFVWSGLTSGWLANLARLPVAGVTVGQVTVNFASFLDPWPMIGVGLLASLTGLACWLAPRPTPEAVTAVLILLALGLSVLYPLLPAVALRYAQAAGRAHQAVESMEAGAWQRLEHAEDGVSERAERRYDQGRSALRWASNLAARDGQSVVTVTYFRQAFLLIVATLLGLGAPLWFSRLRQGIRRAVEGLRRPLFEGLIRAADRGSAPARLLRPMAYWDMVFGLLAAVVVAATLWSPLGTSLGRGKSLYLALPGIPTIQSVELVKALFVLFVTGYFARQGSLLARVARRRYLVPYALAVLGTLALTGVQADLGGLFMLGLFLGLVFLAVTGQVRMVLSLPLLLLPGLALAAVLGVLSVVSTRLEIWLSPRTHALGEQIVQARQLLLSSGEVGFPPHRQLAFRVPDIQGDLVIVAFGERYGWIGLVALIACWFVLVASLVRESRRTEGGAAILHASVAALLLVQFLTQAGGSMGLLPLTGVPIPWLSHGLTASLIFTALLALALATSRSSGAWSPVDRPAVAEASSAHSLRYLDWANLASSATLVLLVVFWTIALPRQEGIGSRGREYRWQDSARRARIDGWIADGLFEPLAASDKMRVSDKGQQVSDKGQRHPRLAELLTVAEGLRRTPSGDFEPLGYLVQGANPFAARAAARGALATRDAVVVAHSDDRGRRSYPLARALYHPVGYGGSLARARGVEARVSSFLTGRTLDRGTRLQAFKADLHHGPDVELTLDSRLQLTAFQELDQRPGGVVVMDLTDGALLVLVSSPAVDPNNAGAQGWRNFARDPDDPLRSRATHSTAVYSPPGSVFKILVAAAIVESELVDARAKTYCSGRDGPLRVSCAHGSVHGAVDLRKALYVSCNVYFARAVVGLEKDALTRMVERFGFNDAASYNLLRGVPEADFRPGVSTVDLSVLRDDSRDLARVGYGQGPVSATPLQIARMGAVIALGGELLDPFLARALALVRRDDQGAPREVAWRRLLNPSRRQVAISRETAEDLRQPLVEVFQIGTARGLDKLWWHPRAGWRLARKEPESVSIEAGTDWRRVDVAGKTGSAWKTRADRTDDAWMVAWAPADAPRVVVSVLVEDAGEGGKVAGPIAMRLLRDSLEAVEHKPR